MALGDEGLLRDVVSSVVQAAGFDLEELTVQSAGRRRVVRVAIDSDDGLDLDVAAGISRQLSAELDRAGDAVLGGAAYTLEVTSPGIGRPLTEPRHFRRAAGRLVALTLADGSTPKARILRLDGDTLVLLSGPDGLQQRRVPLTEITRAKVEAEFGPPPPAVAALLADAEAESEAESESEAETGAARRGSGAERESSDRPPRAAESPQAPQEGKDAR